MSATDALAQAKTDPTGTTTTRRRYARRLRGAFGRISAAVWESVVDNDVFGLREEGLADPLSPGRFPRREDKQIETFDAWLKRQQRQDVLSIIDRNDNQFVRAAYDKGARDAGARLRAAGVDVPIEGIESSFALPVHRDTLQRLYTSDYSDLEGITAEVSKQSNRVLATGFARGETPTTIARDLTDRIDAVGKTRATTLARTSVIDAHAEGALARYERYSDQIDGVTVEAEWQTAGDDRVCSTCQALEGRTFTIKEARTETVTIDGSDVPIKPPAHPRCRCAILPVT